MGQPRSAQYHERERRVGLFALLSAVLSPASGLIVTPAGK
jgi:hypothetical protein